MSYYLSEAYSDLYNPRVDSSFDDNLRFIDFMQDEDIQEVVESVFWEICDYGSTLEEAYDILEEATSLEVINEAYESIAYDFLSEARSDVIARQRAAQAALQQQKQRLQSDQRREARRARVTGVVKGIRKRIDGGISRVQAAMDGARGGIGRAQMAIAPKNKSVASRVSSAVTGGKARLGQLLRRGVRAVSGVLGGVGRSVQRSGQQVARRESEKDLTPSRMTLPSIGGRSFEIVSTPSRRDDVGKKRQALGRSLVKTGRDMRRLLNSKPERMTREQMRQRNAARTSAARAELGDVFAQRPSSDIPTPSRPRVHRRHGRVMPGPRPKSITTSGRVPSVAISTPTTRPTPSYNVDPKTGQLSFGAPSLKLSPARVPPGGQRHYGATRKPKGKGGTRQLPIRFPKPKTVAEQYDIDSIFNQILEDLVYEGYTTSIDESFDFLNDLDDSELNEIIAIYLN